MSAINSDLSVRIPQVAEQKDEKTEQKNEKIKTQFYHVNGTAPKLKSSKDMSSLETLTTRRVKNEILLVSESANSVFSALRLQPTIGTEHSLQLFYTSKNRKAVVEHMTKGENAFEKNSSLLNSDVTPYKKPYDRVITFEDTDSMERALDLITANYTLPEGAVEKIKKLINSRTIYCTESYKADS